MGPSHHLAQANVALGRAPLSDPVMEGFVRQLEYVNSVADRSAGFVWRFQTDEGDATATRVLGDPLVIFNMSVWESVGALMDYVYRSDHAAPMRQRRSWFRKMARPHSALWWVPAGELPTVEDAERRLDLLENLGPTPDAFTFARLYDAHGRPLPRGPRPGQECGV